jgi:hypothetical protein
MHSQAAKKARYSAIALSGLLLVSPALSAAGAGTRAPDAAQELESLKKVCAKCHNLEIVMDTPKSYGDWHDTVQAMVDRGATGTTEQFEDIMDYLHRTMTTIDVNSADADELEIVLNVSQPVAQAILARRTAKRFTGLADLKSVPGIDASSLDSKARLLFFK